MSLLFMDGFDHIANTTDLLKKLSAYSSSTVFTSGGRRGGGYLSLGSSVTKNLEAGESTLIIGFATQFLAMPTSSSPLLYLYDTIGAVYHVTVRVDNAGVFRVYRDSGTANLLGTSSAGEFPGAGAWHYLEIKVVIHDTTGSVTIKVNGTQVLSVTNVDTRNGSSSTVNQILWLAAATTTYIDDLYVLNGSGSAPNNDFLGDCRIDTLLPNANGNYSQLLGSDGNSTDNYLLVDEATPNTSDYTESSNVGNKDSYGMQNLSVITGTIYGAQVSAAVHKDDAGSRSIKVGVRSSSTDSVGSAIALSTSQLYYSNIHETDPATSAAWTESGINAAEALVEVA